MYNKIHAVFMAANTTSILQPMDQGVISNFKSFYSRNTFHKAIDVIDSDSSDGRQQSKSKTFWKGFAILDTMKNIHYSWEDVKISTLTGIWKKDDFQGFKTSAEETTVDVVEMAREVELEMEPEDVTELL